MVTHACYSMYKSISHTLLTNFYQIITHVNFVESLLIGGTIDFLKYV